MNYINKLQNDLMREKEHTVFLEKLLKTLIGDGWDKLTLYDAKLLHDRHAPQQINPADGALTCGCDGFYQLFSVHRPGCTHG